MLPDQFGLEYPRKSEKVGWTRESPCAPEITKYIDAYKYRFEDMNEFFRLLDKEPPTYPATAIYVRNTLLDSIKWLYRVYTESPKFDHTKEASIIWAEKAYSIIKNKNFQNMLAEIAKKFDTDEILITDNILNMVEDTKRETEKVRPR